jgi:hypothetical protein
MSAMAVTGARDFHLEIVPTGFSAQATSTGRSAESSRYSITRLPNNPYHLLMPSVSPMELQDFGALRWIAENDLGFASAFLAVHK